MTCTVRVSQVVVGMVVSLSLLAGCATTEEVEPAEAEVSGVGGDPSPEPLPDPAAAADGNKRLLTTAASTYTATRYPIVLAHGMGGWRKLFGLVDYFFGIPGELSAGGARVYVTEVSSFASTEQRGEQLLDQVEYIAAVTGTKVNLIGHSQGGLDIRYVAAVRPDLVASLTTVGTPHDGAQLADWFLAHTKDGGFTQTVVQVLGNALGFAISLLSGSDNPQDTMAALAQISSDAMAAFNDRYPQGLPATYCGNGPDSQNGIRFYSWSGASPLTNILDVSDAPFAVTTLLSGYDNDGLVDRCGSHFGRVIKDDYRMNHLDEVNQILGLVSLFETSPKSLFRAHANRLKLAGL